MRLLFFISSLRGGGAERVMTTLCNELVKGNEVHLVTNKDITFAYKLDKRIQVHNLVPAGCEASNSVSRFWSLQSSIRRVTKKVKPQVIISFLYNLNFHVLLATLGLSIPVVVSEHTTFDKKHSFKDYFMRFWFNRLADKVIVLTKYDYDYLKKIIPNKKVIPNPLSFPIHYDRSPRKKTILTAGSIDRWEVKGFDNIIFVWGKLAKKYPDWNLEIAGSGSKRNLQYLEELAAKYGVKDRIGFLGFRKDLDQLMRTSSIYVLSSRYEGLPMVLIEAMAQGCACVSFDCVTGPSEIITPGVSGLLVDNQDLVGMEKALSLLIENENLRERISVQGLKEAERFLPEKIVGEWNTVFHEVIISKR